MEITVLNKSVNYDVIGSGTPILFLHGWGGDKESLRKLAISLSESYTCYLLDLPGFGDSENPDKDWGYEQYTEVIERFLLELNLTPILCISHSFGASTAIKAASINSELFDKLVLIAPSFHRPNASKGQNKGVSMLKSILYPFRKQFYRVFYPNSEAVKFKHMEGVFRNVVNTDLSSEISKINNDVLILWGSDDIYTPLNDAYILSEGIKGSKMKIYHGVGHELPVLYPNLIIDDITTFFKQ